MMMGERVVYWRVWEPVSPGIASLVGKAGTDEVKYHEKMKMRRELKKKTLFFSLNIRLIDILYVKQNCIYTIILDTWKSILCILVSTDDFMVTYLNPSFQWEDRCLGVCCVFSRKRSWCVWRWKWVCRRRPCKTSLGVEKWYPAWN